MADTRVSHAPGHEEITGMLTKYPRLTTDDVRLIKRDGSFAAFRPSLPEIVRLSPQLFNVLEKSTGREQLGSILSALGISDTTPVCAALTDLHATGMFSLTDAPDNSSLATNRVTVAPRLKCRTAIIHTTWKCNLTCEHCYVSAGPAASDDQMATEEVCDFIHDFAESGGLFSDFTGGEPLLRKDILFLLSNARSLGLRVGLLSNGWLIDKQRAEQLRACVHEVTVSIDGLHNTHELLRGPGSFDKAMSALLNLQAVGVRTCATTVLTKNNLDELQEIIDILAQHGVHQWNLSIPRESGRAAEHANTISGPLLSILREKDAEIESILRDLHERAQARSLRIVLDESILSTKLRQRVIDSFRPKYDEDEKCCWENVITILPNGDAVACVFFKNLVYGNINKTRFPAILSSDSCTELQQFFHMTFKPGICPYLCSSNCLGSGVVYPKPISGMK